MVLRIIGEETADNERIYICIQDKKGSTKKRFRRPTKRTIVLEVLLGILMSRDIKISEFAEKVGISHRMLQYYIYDGTKPTEEAMDKISSYLGLPKSILFYRKGD